MARIIQLPTAIPATNGVNPNLKFMQTMDDFATISAPGYLNSGNLEGFPVSNQDFLLISYSYVPATGVDDKGWFVVSVVGGVITLTLWSSGGGTGNVILPTQANHVAVYADSIGTLTEDAPVAIMDGGLQVVGECNFTNDVLISGSIGFNVDPPDPSACIDASNAGGGTLGIGFPQMTTAVKNSIGSPLSGLVVFDTDLQALCSYQSGAWSTLGAGGGVILPVTYPHFASFAPSGDGTIQDSGYAAYDFARSGIVEGGKTGDISGTSSGPGPYVFTVPGADNTTAIVVTPRNTAAAVSVIKAEIAGASTGTVTFNADPGALVEVNWIAFFQR